MEPLVFSKLHINAKLFLCQWLLLFVPSWHPSMNPWILRPLMKLLITPVVLYVFLLYIATVAFFGER